MGQYTYQFFDGRAWHPLRVLPFFYGPLRPRQRKEAHHLETVLEGSAVSHPGKHAREMVAICLTPFLRAHRVTEARARSYQQTLAVSAVAKRKWDAGGEAPNPHPCEGPLGV